MLSTVLDALAAICLVAAAYLVAPAAALATAGVLLLVASRKASG